MKTYTYLPPLTRYRSYYLEDDKLVDDEMGEGASTWPAEKMTNVFRYGLWALMDCGVYWQQTSDFCGGAFVCSPSVNVLTRGNQWDMTLGCVEYGPGRTSGPLHMEELKKGSVMESELLDLANYVDLGAKPETEELAEVGLHILAHGIIGRQTDSHRNGLMMAGVPEHCGAEACIEDLYNLFIGYSGALISPCTLKAPRDLNDQAVYGNHTSCTTKLANVSGSTFEFFNENSSTVVAWYSVGFDCGNNGYGERVDAPPEIADEVKKAAAKYVRRGTWRNG